jgi:hypothetical protein
VERLQVELEWAPSAVGSARRLLAAWLDAVGCDADVRAGVVLAGSELVTRAVCDCVGRPVLRASADEHAVRVQVDCDELVGDVTRPELRLCRQVLGALTPAWGYADDGAAPVSWWATFDRSSTPAG